MLFIDTVIYGHKVTTTVEGLLTNDLGGLFRYVLEDDEQRQYLQAYALVKGVDVTILAEQDEANEAVVLRFRNWNQENN